MYLSPNYGRGGLHWTDLIIGINNGPSQPGNKWITMFDRIAGITDKSPFRSPEQADLYATRSAGYLMSTARRGARMMSLQNGTKVLLARHPNLDGKVLLFPPLGGEPIDKEFLRFWREEAPNATLALLTEAQARQIVELGQKPDRYGNPGPVALEIETFLDWRFPIILIDTKSLIEMPGSQFMAFRNRVNQFRTKGTSIQFEETSASELERAFAEIGERWAQSDRFSGYSKEDLLGPTQSVIQLVSARPDKFGCVVMRLDGVTMGFAVYEKPKPGEPANVLTTTVDQDPRFSGASELFYHNLAIMFEAQGIHSFNVGGSESLGLHEFKTKLHTNTVQLFNAVLLMPQPGVHLKYEYTPPKIQPIERRTPTQSVEALALLENTWIHLLPPQRLQVFGLAVHLAASSETAQALMNRWISKGIEVLGEDEIERYLFKILRGEHDLWRVGGVEQFYTPPLFSSSVPEDAISVLNWIIYTAPRPTRERLLSRIAAEVDFSRHPPPPAVLNFRGGHLFGDLLRALKGSCSRIFRGSE